MGDAPACPLCRHVLHRHDAFGCRRESCWCTATPDEGGQRPTTEPPRRSGVLTRRELEVLRRIAAGRTAEGIGSDLYVTADTVKSHTRRIYRKLGVRNRAHAVAIGYLRGLIEEERDGRSG